MQFPRYTAFGVEKVHEKLRKAWMYYWICDFAMYFSGKLWNGVSFERGHGKSRKADGKEMGEWVWERQKYLMGRTDAG